MKKQIFLLFQFCVFSFSAFSQSWINYNDTNGMFSNIANVVTSDKFNNIWVGLGSGGTAAGLDKFDGTSWTHYDTSNSGLPNNNVRALTTDTNGNLWLKFPHDGLTKFDGTNWTTYDTTNSNIPSNYILDIQSDKQNNIWITCQGSLSKFDGITFTNYPYYSMSGLLAIQDSANIWLANWCLEHFNPITGVWAHYDSTNSNIPSDNLSSIAIDTNGIIWLGFWSGIGTGGSPGGLASFDGSTFTTYWPLQSPYTGVYGLAIDSLNNVWASTQCEGLYKYDGISWMHITGVPLSGCSYYVDVDHQGYVWFAEVSSGVWTNNLTVGITQQSANESANLFPNPTNSIITFNLHNSTNIKVFNLLGKIEIEKDFTFIPNRKVELDVSFLSAGIYFIQAGNEVRKFVKE